MAQERCGKGRRIMRKLGQFISGHLGRIFAWEQEITVWVLCGNGWFVSSCEDQFLQELKDRYCPVCPGQQLRIYYQVSEHDVILKHEHQAHRDIFRDTDVLYTPGKGAKNYPHPEMQTGKKRFHVDTS